MRILVLANNWVGWQITGWLRDTDEEIVGLVVHPPERSRYETEIRGSSGLNPDQIFDGSRLREPDVHEAIKQLRADIALSVYFGYILNPGFVGLFPAGVLNLHPSFLPYNRGVYPNVWSIVEGTPAGVSLHYIDGGVDTGDLVAQRQVAVEPVDTGQTLHRKLEVASVALFKETWPQIRTGAAPRIPQPSGKFTSHRLADVSKIDEINLDANYTARTLIDIMRARTFPPFPGAYFKAGERKVYLRLELLYEEDLEQ